MEEVREDVFPVCGQTLMTYRSKDDNLPKDNYQ